MHFTKYDFQTGFLKEFKRVISDSTDFSDRNESIESIDSIYSSNNRNISKSSVSSKSSDSSDSSDSVDKNYNAKFFVNKKKKKMTTNCDENLKTKIVTKLKNSNCYKSQKLQL